MTSSGSQFGKLGLFWQDLGCGRILFPGAGAEWAKKYVRQVRTYTQIVSPGAPFMSHRSRCGKRLPVNLHVLCTNTQNHYICAYVQMLVKMPIEKKKRNCRYKPSLVAAMCANIHSKPFLGFQGDFFKFSKILVNVLRIQS